MLAVLLFSEQFKSDFYGHKWSGYNVDVLQNDNIYSYQG